MDSKTLRQKYLEFFESRGHKIIPSAPLVPENDPTALFNSAGMQPLVPYLLGQPNPEGKRLTSVQKCLRTDDIDEVGDNTHHTFFEMLGNWSLGDYFKQEAITWSYEFITAPEQLNIPKEKLAVSVFAGDEDAPFDQESYDKWIYLGIPTERIAKLPKKNNWWGPAGQTGPCGPDTEMFVWTGKGEASKTFDPDDPNWVEVWNDVFMEYNKTDDGKYDLLKQKNVDTGMGLERMLAVMNGVDDNYQTELFWPIIEELQKDSIKFGVKYGSDEKITRNLRIIADHVKASVFLIKDGVRPSNKLQGYVLRRLLRTAAAKMISTPGSTMPQYLRDLPEIVIDTYKDTNYFTEDDKHIINDIVEEELNRFAGTLDRGLKEFHKLNQVNGKSAFNLFQTYGFPLELTIELAQEKGFTVDREEFKTEFKKHQDLSRTASAGMFKGGLGEQSEITTKYHTTTHLLHSALRKILGESVQQKGSNITSERLRFDFSYPEKISAEKLQEVENLVNQKIKESLSVTSETMGKEEASKSGALGFFIEKYGDQVTVYTIGHPERAERVEGSIFSREICGGPHVKNTADLGNFKIQKEESVSSGIRRIYAVLSL